jgi:hypothetical protein
MKFKDRKEQRQVSETLDGILVPLLNVVTDEVADRLRRAMEIIHNTGFEEGGDS